MDCEPGALADCYKGAATCADYFWSLCLDRCVQALRVWCGTLLLALLLHAPGALGWESGIVPSISPLERALFPLARPAAARRLPAARASKADTDLDFRALLLSIVKDLLAVAHQPAWPAAAFLLLRLAAMLAGERGLRHGDAHVRQYCVDLLASLAAALYRDEAAVQGDLPALRQLVAAQAGAGGPSTSAPADLAEDAPRLLLAYLADRRRGGHASAASARTFLLCQARGGMGLLAACSLLGS